MYSVGMIVEGKVVQVKPFGVFVQLDPKTKGLVHISQVAHHYVKDISELVQEGDTVKVKVLSVDEASGKISLSMKDVSEKPAPPPPPPSSFKEENRPSITLEDMLKDFTRQSNERHADINRRLKKL